MNLRYASISICSALVMAATAQPTLTTPDQVPVIGQTVALRTASAYLSTGDAGASVIFDYWNMFAATPGNRNFYYTPAASVPSADLGSTDGGSDTTFWALESDGLNVVAERTDLTGTVVYPQPLLTLPLPLSYQDEWTDAASVNIVVSGIPVTRVATISGVADAYGTLTLSNTATYDVLRVAVRREVLDNSAVINIRRITNSTSFYEEASAHPVLKLQEDSVQLGTGAWTVTRSVEHVGDAAVVGVQELDANDFTFVAFPNPVSDALTLTFEADKMPSHVELFDAMGHLVATHQVNASVLLLDVKGLAAGLYTLRSMDQAEVLGSRTVVVN